MEIRFSPRDNGACPVCTRAALCVAQRALAESVRDLGGARQSIMEVVVYTCPQFVENSQP